MLRILFILLMSLLPLSAHAAGTEQTHNTLPTTNSTFITTLQSFLSQEDAKRYQEHFIGMVVSGGQHGTIGSLSATPDNLVTYPGGYYTTQTGSAITYVDNSTCYVIAQKALTGNLSNFTRVAGTHYLVDCLSSPKPALPADSAWLMHVTTAGGAITTVVDLRSRVPYAGTYLLAELPTAGQRGRLALVRDVGGGTLYLDNGTTWLQTISSNPLTTTGDLLIGVTGGVPARLGIGSVNQVLGVTAAGGAHEYKSLVAGTGMAVVHTANTVTMSVVSAEVATPPGAVQPYIGTIAPSGWLLCDGASYDADTYTTYFDVYVSNASVWGPGTATGTFTVNTGTDTLTLAAHGLAIGSRVHVVNSGGALPTGLAANTKYFVINTTTDTLQLSLTSGGAAVDITTAGSGTHSLSNQFQVPDLRARTIVGTGAKNVDWAISSVDTGTEQITVTSNTALYTGDVVFYDTTVGAIGGLTDATNYYVIRVSATVVKLATTEVNANNGVVLDLTSGGSGTQVLRQVLTTRTVGTFGGTENDAGVGAHNHAITDPTHAHTTAVTNAFGTGSTNTLTTTGGGSSTDFGSSSDTTGVTINNRGGLEAGSNLSPFLAITFIVKT